MPKRPPKIALHWQILIGLTLGLVLGLILNRTWGDGTWATLGIADPAAYLAGQAHERNNPNIIATAAYFIHNLNQLVGDLFMNALRFIAVPVVLFTLITGVASVGNPKQAGRMGLKTIALFLGTSMIAVTVGLVAVNIIHPGSFLDDQSPVIQAARDAAENSLSRERATFDAATANMGARKDIWDTLSSLVTTNPFAALAEGNMIQVVVFSLAIGLGLTLIPEGKSRPVVEFCDGMAEVIIKLVVLLMRIAPYAVFALIVPVITNLGLPVLSALLAYSLTVVAGLLVMMLGVYPTIAYLFTKPGNKVTYPRLFKGLAPAQLLAFSSSSSSATLPVTMECVRDRLGVSEEITSFVCPLGSTINMDGTALYQAVAVVFISQFALITGLTDEPLSFTQQLTIVLTATLVSIGTAGVPGASIVLMIVVLESVGLADVAPVGIALVIGVDRILDMCRTAVNITGDAAVATAVAATEGQLRTPQQLALELEHESQEQAGV